MEIFEPVSSLGLELTRKLDHQRSAQEKTPLTSWTVRADRLRRLRSLILENRERIAAAINHDFSRRPQEETDLLEVFPSINGINHALRHGRKWMKPRRRKTGRWFKPASSVLLPQPLGVIGIIVPWNYPLFLAAGPLTSALVAGNRAMVKLPELTPAFSALFAELTLNYFDPAEVTVINGGVDVARAFTRLRFDHLLFTGSTPVGRDVMREASANLTPVTLELGGKSPAIIGPGADFEAAVKAILRGKLVNAGQTCIAPDYVLLPKGDAGRFIGTARKIFNAMHPEARELQDYTCVISTQHHARLNRLINDAVQTGATAHQLALNPATSKGRCLPPVLLTGVSEDMTVMQQEIFGPILPLMTYESLEEAIKYVNSHPRPLALYMFERNRRNIDQVVTQTVAGGVTVNDTLLHIAQDDLPFGGVGDSGMGAYHGQDGFNTFSKIKPIVYQSWLNGMWLVQPPYGNRFNLVMRRMLR